MNSSGFVTGGRGLGRRPRNETLLAYGQADRQTAHARQGASQ
jgi:hypothetical protein